MLESLYGLESLLVRLAILWAICLGWCSASPQEFRKRAFCFMLEITVVMVLLFVVENAIIYILSH